jgi:hypothetical protein
MESCGSKTIGTERKSARFTFKKPPLIGCSHHYSIHLIRPINTLRWSDPGLFFAEYRRQLTPSSDYDIICGIEGLHMDFRAELGRYLVCDCKDWADRAVDFTDCEILSCVRLREVQERQNHSCKLLGDPA